MEGAFYCQNITEMTNRRVLCTDKLLSVQGALHLSVQSTLCLSFLLYFDSAKHSLFVISVCHFHLSFLFVISICHFCLSVQSTLHLSFLLCFDNAKHSPVCHFCYVLIVQSTLHLSPLFV